MKKAISLFITVVSFVCLLNSVPLSVNASENSPQTIIEMLDNGYYFETIIENEETPTITGTRATTQYVTKAKTTQYKNSAGTVLWSVSIKATFSYDGTTSKCTSCTPSASSSDSSWTINSVTSSKSGSSATATAVVTYTAPSGATQSYTKSVTIKCSATGTVS